MVKDKDLLKLLPRTKVYFPCGCYCELDHENLTVEPGEVICQKCREEGIEELTEDEARIIYLHALNKGLNLTSNLIPEEELREVDFLDLANLKEVHLDLELYRLLFEARYCDYI